MPLSNYLSQNLSGTISDHKMRSFSSLRSLAICKRKVEDGTNTMRARKDPMTSHSIAGEWHGRYGYDGIPNKGSDFVAFFSEISGSLGGTIVDDGSTGKASVTGSFSFPSLQFVKAYVKVTESTRVEKKFNPKFKMFGIGLGTMTTTTIKETNANPVYYDGTMSDDGRTLGGKWAIKNEKGMAIASGTWTANKLLEDEEQKEVKEKVGRVKGREVEEVS
jgi:hypothetical protein